MKRAHKIIPRWELFEVSLGWDERGASERDIVVASWVLTLVEVVLVLPGWCIVR